MKTGPIERLFTPRRLVVALGLLLVIALLRPQGSGVDSQARLTTYSADANGASGIYDVLDELDVDVERRTSGFRGDLDTNAVYTVLAPRIDLTASEVGRLLEVVRRGAGLIVVPAPGSRISDSLRIVASAEPSIWTPLLQPTNAEYATPVSKVKSQIQLWPRAVLLPLEPLPEDTTAMLSAKYGTRVRPVVLGMPIGEGRVVAIADPTFLRNDVLRHGRTPILAVRMFEYAAPRARARVIFDEYHHGFGAHANVFGAIGRFLGRTPPGLVILQAAVAGLILILALAPRPLPPPARERFERRSALEHVEALAMAYDRAEATKTVARHLVRGLRRRYPFAVAGSLDEIQYLDVVRARRPATAPDVQVIAAACRSGVPRSRLAELQTSFDRVDQSLRGS